MVEEYKDFLAILEEEMMSIRCFDVSVEVDERVADFRVRIMDEETVKKEKAIVEKQLEIDASNRILARLLANESKKADIADEGGVA